jgi:hypothetical protein
MTTDTQAVELERSLLASYCLGADISPRVSKDTFHNLAHKAVFQVIQDLLAKGITEVKLVMLVNELEKRGRLDEAGGPGYIAELFNSIPTAVNTTYYEGEVLAAHRARAAKAALLKALDELRAGADPDATYARMTQGFTPMESADDQNGGIDFNDLLKAQFPPDEWLVEGLITTGLTVLTGASKIGKSWAALQLVTALDHGGCFLGTLKASKCDVLYCALEDTPKRIQRRLKKQGVESFGGSRLETKRRSPAELYAFLRENPRFRVVVIDTFQKMMGIGDLNDYSQTVNGMSALKDIADSLNIAVIVIHHNRKGAGKNGDHMESALGSTGINATADTTLTMYRERGTSEATLSVTGRDAEDSSYTLSWDAAVCSWSVTDSGALRPAVSEAQQQIIDLLESEERNWTVSEIAKVLEKGKSTVSEQTARLFKQGWIDRPITGLYRAKIDTRSVVRSPQTERNRTPERPVVGLDNSSLKYENSPFGRSVSVQRPNEPNGTQPHGESSMFTHPLVGVCEHTNTSPVTRPPPETERPVVEEPLELW